MTCHFIHDWTMQSVTLGCKRFKGKHTADNISLEYEVISAGYDLNGKISNVITDNASNMIKAFCLPGFTANQLTESDHDDEDNEDPDDDPESVDLGDDLPLVAQHDPCFVHSLQLVVKDGFKIHQE